MLTISEFCAYHDACEDGLEWALATGCKTMRDLWERTDIPHAWRIWIATRPGVLSDRDARLFACWCVRQVWHLLTDERSRHAVEVAERYAVGEATDSDLVAAWEAAWEAARAAAWAAARESFMEAAWAEARDAAKEAQAQHLLTLPVNLEEL